MDIAAVACTRLTRALSISPPAVAFGAVLIFAFGLYPIATRSSWWVYKGPALVAQASRAKDPIGDEPSVRAANSEMAAAPQGAAAPL